MSANSYLNTTKVHLYSLWITTYNEYTTYFLVYNFLDPGVSSFFLFSVWSDHVNYCVRMQIVMLVWLFVVHAPQDLVGSPNKTDLLCVCEWVRLHIGNQYCFVTSNSGPHTLTPSAVARALSTKSIVRVNSKCKNRSLGFYSTIFSLIFIFIESTSSPFFVCLAISSLFKTLFSKFAWSNPYRKYQRNPKPTVLMFTKNK